MAVDTEKASPICRRLVTKKRLPRCCVVSIEKVPVGCFRVSSKIESSTISPSPESSFSISNRETFFLRDVHELLLAFFCNANCRVKVRINEHLRISAGANGKVGYSSSTLSNYAFKVQKSTSLRCNFFFKASNSGKCLSVCEHATRHAHSEE